MVASPLSEKESVLDDNGMAAHESGNDKPIRRHSLYPSHLLALLETKNRSTKRLTKDNHAKYGGDWQQRWRLAAALPCTIVRGTSSETHAFDQREAYFQNSIYNCFMSTNQVQLRSRIPKCGKIVPG